MNDDTASPVSLADAAVAYAKAGHAVLPLKPGTKVPATPNGLNDATTDVETVRRWWKSNPDCNIGLRPAQGVAIIDVESFAGHDVDGYATLAALVEQLGPLPEDAPTAETATGGLHVWLAGVDGPTVAKLGDGIDVKTHTGYLVAAPSVIEGSQYRWRSAALNGVELPLAPTAWASRLGKPAPVQQTSVTRVAATPRVGNVPYVTKTVTDELDALSRCPKGGGRWQGRYDELNSAAIRLARMPDVDRQWLRAELIEASRDNGYLGEEGIRKVERDITSAFAYADRQGPALIPEFRAPSTTESPDSDGVDSDDDETPVYADRLLSRSDLLMLPDPQPLIDNVLDQGTVALLYGKWGTAKTFIALDWAASVATGRNWQGRKTEQRRVLYVVGEGAFGFKGRAAAWELGWQTKIGDESLSILPSPVNLTNATEVANLRALIEWGGYSFVILDTLARCMVGADENSAQDGGIVVDAMTRLVSSTPGGRGVVLGVHHTGKDGKTLRGSSAFESGADTVYCATRDETLISLTREKRKDGPENDSHLLVFEPMPGTDSGVMNVSRGVSQGGETTDRAATLRAIMSQSFRLTGATATRLQQAAVEDGPLSRPTYYRAVTDLLKSGWLINTGTDKRPFYFIRDDDD